MLNFCFLTSKRYILARNHVVWRTTRENRFGGLGCEALEEPAPKKNKKAELTLLMHNFAHTGKGNPLRDRD